MRSLNQMSRKIWRGNPDALQSGPEAYRSAISQIDKPVFVVGRRGDALVTQEGTLIWGEDCEKSADDHELLAFAPPLSPGQLGDESFKKDLGLKYAYVVGAMANGITSVEMVSAAGKAGLIGFFWRRRADPWPDRDCHRPIFGAARQFPLRFQPDSQPQRYAA